MSLMSVCNHCHDLNSSPTEVKGSTMSPNDCPAWFFRPYSPNDTGVPRLIVADGAAVRHNPDSAVVMAAKI